MFSRNKHIFRYAKIVLVNFKDVNLFFDYIYLLYTCQSLNIGLQTEW